MTADNSNNSMNHDKQIPANSRENLEKVRLDMKATSSSVQSERKKKWT